MPSASLLAETSDLLSALDSAFDSALGSEAASDLDSALLSDSGSALELPDAVPDDADDELLVLWEELAVPLEAEAEPAGEAVLSLLEEL